VAPSFTALARDYSSAAVATTVRPSVTVAALASLATGVSPATHGLVTPGLGFLSTLGGLQPVARVLAHNRIPTVVTAGGLPARSRAVAWALATCAGVSRLVAAEGPARGVAAAALSVLARLNDGLLLVYLPDADQAGHAHGWMSAPYLEAVAEVDAALGWLSGVVSDTLLVVVADHGGGGTHPREHDSPHPANERIPLVLAGPRVARRRIIRRPVSILDVPPTVMSWLGVAAPVSFEGRALPEARCGARRRRVRAAA
jgi:hypothetical protein